MWTNGPVHQPKNEAALDEVAKDLTAGAQGCPAEGYRYRELPVEQRVIVMQLTQQRIMMEVLDDIDTSLGHVGEWFQKSRLWDGP